MKPNHLTFQCECSYRHSPTKVTFTSRWSSKKLFKELYQRRTGGPQTTQRMLLKSLLKTTLRSSINWSLSKNQLPVHLLLLNLVAVWMLLLLTYQVIIRSPATWSLTFRTSTHRNCAKWAPSTSSWPSRWAKTSRRHAQCSSPSTSHSDSRPPRCRHVLWMHWNLTMQSGRQSNSKQFWVKSKSTNAWLIQHQHQLQQQVISSQRYYKGSLMTLMLSLLSIR